VGGLAIGTVFLILRIATHHDSGLQADQAKRVNTLALLLSGEISNESTGGRMQYWINGIRQWADSPIWGHGIGTQRRIQNEVMTEAGSHNTFLRVLGESGIVPFFLLLIFLWVFFREGQRTKTPYVKTLVLGYFIVMFMSCMTSHNVLTHRHQNAMLGACFGLMAAAREIEAAERRRKPQPKPQLRPAI
jgi:O-antigen ligase